MTIADELQATIEQMVQHGKGILAADESQPTIAKRFAAIGVEPTANNCRAYRTLLFTAPDIENYKGILHALHRHHVALEHMILKPNMVLPGKDHPVSASATEIAAATIRVLRRTVPAAVPSINFLSGGLSPEEATANLNTMNANFPAMPWLLSFSYGRALQQTVLQAWHGKAENVVAAQQALLKRARLNGAAQRGEYLPAMEFSS